MDASRRHVTRLPLEQLWDENGFFGRRLRDLTREDVRSLVSQGPVRFVEANVGEPLRWVPLPDCYSHWKAVAPNISNSEHIYLDEFPGAFAFSASEWEGRLGERLVVLEMHH